ncbi:MAG: ATP-dependent helicase [Clostridiaceae bacterium]
MNFLELAAKYMKLRDIIIERYFCNLSDEQLSAVLSGDKKILVAACPGAGKTQVIVNRIIYLAIFGETYKSTKYPENLSSSDIDELSDFLKRKAPLRKYKVPESLIYEAVDIDNIVVITFTRMAAMSMKERYEKISGLKETPFFGTFHSLFFRILRSNVSSVKIINESETYGIIEKAAGNYKDSVDENKIKGILNDISLHKTAVKLKMQYRVKTDKEVFHYCLDKYEEYKRKKLLRDFDDLSIECLELLEEKPDILYGLRRKIKHILVDEFQDCDSLQIQMIKLLAKGNSIFAVGDEDQCIYGFRGSRPDCMVDFARHFAGGRKLFLSKNYRSGSDIVTASKNVISKNISRNNKEMASVRRDPGIIELVVCESERHQADSVSGLVLKLTEKCSLNETAVLYRTNKEAALLASSLAKHKLQYRIMDKDSNFFQDDLCRDILSYLKLSLNAFDKESFVRIINKPYRYIGSTKIEKLKSFRYSRNPFSFIAGMPDTSINQVTIMRQLEKSIAKLIKMKPEKALDYLLNKINYQDYIEKHDMNSSRLEELKTIMCNFSSVEEFIRFTDEYASVARKTDETGERVTLSTIHGVKGLEFNNVILVNCRKDSMPHINSRENIEEERRLFYVGITRAADKLWILYPETCKGTQTEISPFIDECCMEFDIVKQ